jgi:hypothetical protein
VGRAWFGCRHHGLGSRSQQQTMTTYGSALISRS